MTTRCLIAGLLVASLASAADAHGGHDDTIKVLVTDTDVRIETRLDAQDLAVLDQDGDGVLTAGEFRDQQDVLDMWIDERLALLAGDGDALRPRFRDTPVADLARAPDEAPITRVRVIRVFDRPPPQTGLRLRVALPSPAAGARAFTVWTPDGASHGTVSSAPTIIAVE